MECIWVGVALRWVECGVSSCVLRVTLSFTKKMFEKKEKGTFSRAPSDTDIFKEEGYKTYFCRKRNFQRHPEKVTYS